MDALTAEERIEMEEMRYRLLDAEGRMTKDCYMHRMPVINAISNNNIELVRVYDKFLFTTIATTYHLGVMYRAALLIGQKPSAFLTNDHRMAWQGWIHPALQKQSSSVRDLPRNNNEEVCALVLETYPRPDLILRLIEDRGLVDARSLREVLSMMEVTPTLSEGVL